MIRFLPLISLAALPAAAATPGATPADARATVQAYYAAIDRGRYAAAYDLWGGHGRASGKSYDAFVRGFARTARTGVVAGRPFDQEGAAGSTYITVPVEVRATLKDGRRQRFTGRYVLRRVNDIDGSSAWDRRWHIASASLRAVRP